MDLVLGQGGVAHAVHGRVDEVPIDLDDDALSKHERAGVDVSSGGSVDLIGVEHQFLGGFGSSCVLRVPQAHQAIEIEGVDSGFVGLAGSSLD